jgi:tetratricopeptide (TPR) repeat protein
VSLRRALRWLTWGLLVTAQGPHVARAFANVEVGQAIDDLELRTLDGKPHRLIARGAVANVVVFFRPQQERSTDTLKDMAGCEKEFAAKPVHWVGVVSDSWSADEVRAVIAETGIRMPVVFDRGDELYGRLGVRLHPVIGIFDAQRRLAAYEPFREINYCDRVRAQIRFVLGEMTAAELAKVQDPERSETRSDAGVAGRHTSFARSLFRIQKYDKALAEVQKSLMVTPTAGAYALQGQILAAQGNCADALRAFDAALRLEPTNADALEGRKACGR